MDWKDVVSKVAPVLGSIALGPAGGAAVSVLSNVLLGGSSGDPVQDEAKIAGILAGPMTPELQAKIIDAETMLKIEMRKAATEEKRIDADVEKAYLADVADARHSRKDAELAGVMRLGAGVLVGWMILTGLTIIGLFLVMTGGIKVVDVGIAATAFTVLGSIIGYLSGSAQQVLSYYFGSSRGSDKKTTAMSDAIAAAGKPSA